jgi:hypothetical protein
MRRKDPIMIYLDFAQTDALRALSAETQVPRARLIRNAVDDYLATIERRRAAGERLLPLLGDE